MLLFLIKVHFEMRFHTHLKEELTKEKIQIILGGDAETYSTHAVCICM